MDFNHNRILICIGVPTALLMYTFGFMIFFVQRRYIIKRYEVETNLAETERFFEIGRTIVILFPIMKSAFYSMHLLMIMLMSDKSMKKNFRFKDSPSRKEILSHFSKKERVLTAVSLGCGFLSIPFMIAFCFLDWFWNH